MGIELSPNQGRQRVGNRNGHDVTWSPQPFQRQGTVGSRHDERRSLAVLCSLR